MSYHLDPSRKRGDLGPDSDNLKTGVQRDEQGWFSDGNIVVVAANEVAFRVHKGILSLRSEVFRDLFSLANTGTDAATAEVDSETIEGCAVVHLTDPPEDVRHLFLVLCCGKNYYYDCDAVIPVPFSVLASLVRMAHKYAVPDVLADALSRLKKYYTDDLATWQDPSARARHVAAVEEDGPSAIHLARLTNTPSLLPAAFLVCSTELATLWDQDPDSACVSRMAALSVPDQSHAIVGRGFLVQARAFHLLGDAPLAALHGKPYLFKSSMSEAHALAPMADIFWARCSHWRKFCESCREALVEEDGMVIRLLWCHLPHLFGLRVDADSWPPSSGSAVQTSSSR
ncbi:hypothetical protein V8D89_009352 [Ganoderma adspersum]